MNRLKILMGIAFLSFLTTNAQVTNTFPDNGNVGIGTTSPDSKLTVKGNVNIGGDGNYRLKVRHIDGKSHLNANLADLHLNWNNGKRVLVGWGSTNPSSDLLVSGRLGIGTISPSHHIDVVNEHQPTESFLRFRVKDALSDYFTVYNATGASGQFIPVLKGHHVTDNRSSLYVMGSTMDSNDNGSTALVAFDARRLNGPIQTRPLFVWTSYTTKMMTMLANGNLGIGTTNPGSYKLAVKGKIRAEEIKVETGWADYVFEEEYDLPTLEEVERHIKETGHLINIPSAREVEEKGIQLGEMNKLLLEKIEELTLYTLQQQKEIKTQKEKNKSLEARLQKLEKLWVMVNENNNK
ncbi:hypothetical protein L0P88_08770 [Muricauda sp. SCSIO 64092]|uniref:hypothetical protein n=1 Tax=Allomuricauda sp. SCSIO 64092 TaxID=2908842 RepID=UPI001FF3B3C9|nr:hypothetical protein [Muricauda sp. SCSIO 64092]UOY08631.1 hypothetical protein L0P88_08770 [Muricauda sp. SCSIO 64092]